MPCRIRLGTSICFRSSVRPVSENALMRKVEGGHRLRQVVGIGVEVVALPWLAGASVAALIMGDTAIAVCGRKNTWSSNASALNGPPWRKTAGCPFPNRYSKPGCGPWW